MSLGCFEHGESIHHPLPVLRFAIIQAGSFQSWRNSLHLFLGLPLSGLETCTLSHVGSTVEKTGQLGFELNVENNTKFLDNSHIFWFQNCGRLEVKLQAVHI